MLSTLRNQGIARGAAGSATAAGSGGGRNVFSIGKANSAVAAASKPKVKFADVAGLDAAKREVVEFVDFLKKPQRYEKLGVTVCV